MRATASLRLRTALALSLLVTAIWLGAALVTFRLLKAEMGEVFDSALQETGQRILQLAVIDILGRDGDVAPQHVTALGPHEEYFTYIVRDAAGQVLLSSHRAEAGAFPVIDGEGFRQSTTHRLYQETAVSGSVVLTIAEPLAHRHEVAHEVALALGLPLLLVLPLSIIAIFFGLRYGLKPLDLLRRQVAARGANDLSPLPEAGLPQELRPIAAGMSALLARLEQSFKAERSFAANAAHELRTPLAGAVMQVQRLRKATAEPATAAKAAEVEAALKRLSHLSERLLQLARAEGARLTLAEAADLRPVLELVASDFLRAGADLHLTLPDLPMLSRMDPDAAAIIARNLFENALRHGTGAVVAALSPDGWLVVDNDAPAVLPDDLIRLKSPFARGAAPAVTGTEGAGLGLAIVARIAARAGTDLRLTSPLPGQTRGFRAALRLIPLETDERTKP
jgi:two-component system, OmpR family, sensor kinase